MFCLCSHTYVDVHPNKRTQKSTVTSIGNLLQFSFLFLSPPSFMTHAKVKAHAAAVVCGWCKKAMCGCLCGSWERDLCACFYIANTFWVPEIVAPRSIDPCDKRLQLKVSEEPFFVVYSLLVYCSDVSRDWGKENHIESSSELISWRADVKISLIRSNKVNFKL